MKNLWLDLDRDLIEFSASFKLNLLLSPPTPWKAQVVRAGAKLCLLGGKLHSRAEIIINRHAYILSKKREEEERAERERERVR